MITTMRRLQRGDEAGLESDPLHIERPPPITPDHRTSLAASHGVTESLPDCGAEMLSRTSERLRSNCVLVETNTRSGLPRDPRFEDFSPHARSIVVRTQGAPVLSRGMDTVPQSTRPTSLRAVHRDASVQFQIENARLGVPSVAALPERVRRA